MADGLLLIASEEQEALVIERLRLEHIAPGLLGKDPSGGRPCRKPLVRIEPTVDGVG